jgi:hypothetical protein
MHKYLIVNSLVNKLTENEALQTFFTLFLMAQNAAEKQHVEQQFWTELAILPTAEKNEMRKKLQATFLKLPQLTAELHRRVADFQAEQSLKLAA